VFSRDTGSATKSHAPPHFRSINRQEFIVTISRRHSIGASARSIAIPIDQPARASDPLAL
jgi:hypothetical protein